ncbi:unnamed protein product [Urochloa humidicola]
MAAAQGAGGGGGGRHNKFFKVLLPGSFEMRLSIPPKFAAALGGAFPKAKLRDGSGRSWDVELHRDGRRVSLTGSGWRAFVSANGISAGQLLVFEHHQRGCCVDLDLAVDIFDTSGCCLTNDDMDMIKRRKLSSPTSSDETLCRRIESPYQLRLLDVSKTFCERLGWTSSRDVHLMVRAAAAAGDNNHRIWPVSVKVSAKSGMMCAGWAEFAQDNRLAISDACAFLPLDVQGTALHVRIIRGTTGTITGPCDPDPMANATTGLQPSVPSSQLHFCLKGNGMQE